MIPTGRQIREARALLGLSRSQLAHKAVRVSSLAILRAEEGEDEPRLSPVQAAAIRRTLERLGVEFTHEGDGGVRLRKGGAP